MKFPLPKSALSARFLPESPLLNAVRFARYCQSTRGSLIPRLNKTQQAICIGISGISTSFLLYVGQPLNGLFPISQIYVGLASIKIRSEPTRGFCNLVFGNITQLLPILRRFKLDHISEYHSFVAKNYRILARFTGAASSIEVIRVNWRVWVKWRIDVYGASIYSNCRTIWRVCGCRHGSTGMYFHLLYCF